MRLQLAGTKPLVVSVLAALLAAAPAAWGQARRMGVNVQVAPADPGGAAIEGSDNTAGVYVKDSAIAREKFAHAQRMESLKEWGTSADLYQEILEKYPDRVVPAGVDANNQIVQYTSVTEAVRQALCAWPQQGLDVYRGRYETTAANLLSGAGANDLATLHKVFSFYFPTDSARTAGLRLMDYYFENGEYSAVAQIGRRLLEWHPNLIAQRPEVLYRVAIAEKLCGDGDDAARWLKELQSRFAKVTGTVRGTDVVLADSLANELKSVGPIVRAATDDSWPTFAGDFSRNKSSSATAFAGAKLYSIALSHASVADASGATTANLGVMPVVERGELFFQDNLRLYAVNLDSGLPLSGWAANYPGSNGQYVVPGNGVVPLAAGHQFCMTLTDKYVLAVMGMPDAVTQINSGQVSDAHLVCLDRATGRQRWIQSVHNLPAGGAATNNLEIGGAPLIVGDNVYIMGHGGKGGGTFQDCYVLCFGLESGNFKWASYVASSGIQNGQMWMMMGQPNMAVSEDANSAMAYASGRIFAVSNIGAVAALDAYNGSIIWLDIYRETSDVPSVNRFGGMMQFDGTPGAVRPVRPWIGNPAVVQDGKLFVRPLDKDCLLVYDVGSGKEIKRIRLSDFGSDNAAADNDSMMGSPVMLLGAAGDCVIMAGNHGVWNIPWKAYDSDHNRSPNGFWRSAALVGESKDKMVQGRPFVTADSVYVPTNCNLTPLSLRSGMVDQKKGCFPKNDWDPAEGGPGNIVVAQDEVVIAGNARVDVYSDLDMAMAKLDRGVTEAPADPQPRLRYAEVMFAAGRTGTAWEKLAQAMQLLETPQGLRIGADRARAFGDALSFAVKLSERKAPLDETNKMFDAAGLTAQTPWQQVAYLTARAKFDLGGADIGAAVDCYQEILTDEATRLVALPDQETGQSSQAGIVAEKAIFNLLSNPRGTAAYEKYEKQAAQRLAGATAAADPQQLLAIAQVYPNSQVARQAMLAAADIFESKSNYRMATQVLRRLLIKYSDSGRIPVLEAMARNYLKIPGRLDVSIARLATAIKLMPNARLTKPLTLPDGTVLQSSSLKQAYDVLVRYSASLSTESLPDFNLPTKEELLAYGHAHPGNRAPSFQAELLVPNVGTLLKPLDGFSRYDRLATWTGDGGLALYPVGADKPLVQFPAIAGKPLSIAWLGDKALVWGDGAIHLLAADSGKTLWNLEMTGLPPIEVAAAESQPAQPSAAPPANGPGNVQVRNLRELVAANAAGGGKGLFGSVNGGGPQAGPEQIDLVRPVGDRIVIASTTGRILAIDAADGQIAWQTRVANHGVGRLCANDDFTVVECADDQTIRLIVLNSYSGELVAHKTFAVTDPTLDYPVNLALAADGNLVYTTPVQVCVKDLYDADLSEHGLDPKVSSPQVPAHPMPLFEGCDGADQLLISRGLIFALAEMGREVHVYDLDTAQPTRQHNPDANGQVPVIYASGNTGGAASGVAIKTCGDYLYVRSSNSVHAYKLSQNFSWNGATIENEVAVDWLFGRDALMLVSHPGTPLAESNKVDPRLILHGYSRRPAQFHPQNESGALITDRLMLQDPAGISGLQAVAGGVAYISGDGVMHTLLGAHGHLQE